MLPVIRKRINNSRAAAKEAENAVRNDLRDKELKQAAVLEAYIDSSNILGEEDIKAAAQEAVSNLQRDGRKVTKGDLMRSLLGPNGLLHGQLLEKKDVAMIVDRMV